MGRGVAVIGFLLLAHGARAEGTLVHESEPAAKAPAAMPHFIQFKNDFGSIDIREEQKTHRFAYLRPEMSLRLKVGDRSDFEVSGYARTGFATSTAMAMLNAGGVDLGYAVGVTYTLAESDRWKWSLGTGYSYRRSLFVSLVHALRKDDIHQVLAKIKVYRTPVVLAVRYRPRPVLRFEGDAGAAHLSPDEQWNDMRPKWGYGGGLKAGVDLRWVGLVPLWWDAGARLSDAGTEDREFRWFTSFSRHFQNGLRLGFEVAKGYRKFTGLVDAQELNLAMSLGSTL